jgi:TonB family protein
LFPIVKAANVEQATPPSGPGAEASMASGSRVALHDNLDLREMRLRASSVELALDQQTGEAVAARPVTPENPIPRRTRGVVPARPPRYASVPVVVSARVTVDRNGAVTSVEPDSCSTSGGPGADAAVCAAFHDATAAAIRQWRYDRPSQAPIQFYVRVTFRPAAEAAIVQSGESVDLRVLAEQARHGDDGIGADFVRFQFAELSARFRELERAQRLAIERGAPNPDMVRLQQELARLNDEMAGLQKQLLQQLVGTRSQERIDDLERLMVQLQAVRQSLALRSHEEEERALRANLEANARAEEQTRAALDRLREAQRALAEAKRRLAEQSTSADVSPEPAPAVDGSRQLVSPSGRAPLRMNGAPPPGLQQPTPTKSVKPTYPLDAMEARLQGTVAVEALVDERGRVADARVLRGISPLDQAALEAAKQWEFRPAMLNGEPVPVLLVLEMHFTLK